MNYEKIILELLGRIQVLEEQIAMLMNAKTQALEEETNRISTDDIRHHIVELKKTAKESGNKFIVLKSGDIHKELNLKSRMPQVCNAMRQSMNEGDIVLHTTPSGNSSTIEIQYYVWWRFLMTKRYSKPGRRTGLFIGGVMFGIVRGIFFKNKYWGKNYEFIEIK